MNSTVSSGVAVAVAIVGLAAVAIIVSQMANTSQVVQASGNSFINAIKCAIAPITGTPCASSVPFGYSTSTITFG